MNLRVERTEAEKNPLKDGFYRLFSDDKYQNVVAEGWTDSRVTYYLKD